jgi:protoheme IX farnesyltransferase
MHDDYSRAGVPMLTVTHGRQATRRQILIYSVILSVISIAMAFTAVGGLVFLAAAVVLNALLLRSAWAIAGRDEDLADDDRYATERKFFRLTLVYLFVMFLAVWLESGLRAFGF